MRDQQRDVARDPARDGVEAFHVTAWLTWVVAVCSVVVAIRNPAVVLVAMLSLGVVSSAFARRDDGIARAMVRVGLVVIFARVLLFGLTGHTGDTFLVSLPEVKLPGWLGGFAIGGRVTAEVLAESAAEGLRIAALLAAFGVFLSVVRTSRLLRLLPGALFEAALVITIGVAFVPAMVRQARDIAEAQRLRGHRLRGVRSVVPLVAPVVAGGLERSVALAASMEVRGYGRTTGGARRREAAARRLLLVALLAVVGGVGILVSGRRTVGSLVLVLGMIACAASLRLVGRAIARTRYRTDVFEAHDRVLVATSLATIVAAFAARGIAASSWYAYPRVTMPILDPRLLGVALLLVAPVVIDAVRRARWRSAAREHVLVAVEEVA